jgi:hypothetical protein
LAAPLKQRRITALWLRRLQEERGYRGLCHDQNLPPEVAWMVFFRQLAPVMIMVLMSPWSSFASNFLPPARKAKTAGDAKISALISTLKEDPDETKRIHAAIELRTVDPKTNPDAIEGLMEALKTDKKPSVRAEAANSLGRIRGGQDFAGPALEEALVSDGSMRVRLQARSALMGLYLSGYRSANGRSLPKPEESSGDLEKLVEAPARLEAKSSLPPDRVSSKMAPGKETSLNERFGFKVIPSWMSRREPGPSDMQAKTGDSKWWTPRIPTLPNILGKSPKDTKEAELDVDEETEKPVKGPKDKPQ